MTHCLVNFLLQSPEIRFKLNGHLSQKLLIQTDPYHFHRSQDRDMGNVRRFRSAFRLLYLCQVDAFTQIADPAEVQTSARTM